MKAAVIGIGSNSVRMLVIEIKDGQTVRLRRDRAGTRLFAGLDAQKNLAPEAMKRTADAVAEMAAAARNEGAEEVRLFATSATRDAANSAEFAKLLEEKADVTLEICSGEEEAALSFLGAAGGGFCGVIDIGGGSTEIVVGQGMDIHMAFSCQMGAVRLFREYPITCAKDNETVIRAAGDILEEQLQVQKKIGMPEMWTGTGGTFTSLAAMVRGIPWTMRTFLTGTELKLADVEKLADMLAGMPMEERLKLPGLQPNRADIVVHGICILIACMRRLGIESITVSEYGNLDGYVLHHYRLPLTGRA